MGLSEKTQRITLKDKIWVNSRGTNSSAKHYTRLLAQMRKLQNKRRNICTAAKMFVWINNFLQHMAWSSTNLTEIDLSELLLCSSVSELCSCWAAPMQTRRLLSGAPFQRRHQPEWAMETDEEEVQRQTEWQEPARCSDSLSQDNAVNSCRIVQVKFNIFTQSVISPREVCCCWCRQTRFRPLSM